ncbi:MAG: ornithine carbamoyltransferase [Chloroflexi bacterium]|nr:ornithine carbamoyltransferase [Chloroflexota bacterium]
MKAKHLISVADLSSDDISEILNTAGRLKADQRSGRQAPVLAGKNLALIFEKPSLRTRVSFELAMVQLGGHALYLSPNEVQLGKRETVPDIARVLSRYVDVMVIRTFDHHNVQTLAKFSSVPVINGLSDLSHPCQAISDLLTIQEKKGRLKGLRLAYIGDGNNVAHSLILAGCKVGMNVAIATPPGYECEPEIVQTAREFAAESGAGLELTHSPWEAVKHADIVYTDVWASMGQEAERERRALAFASYQVNASLLEDAAVDVIVMHCLPAHRGEEITDDVIEGSRSVVFDQAENRLHVQKALLVLLV